MDLTIEPNATPTADSTLPEERACVVGVEWGPKYGTCIDQVMARVPSEISSLHRRDGRHP